MSPIVPLAEPECVRDADCSQSRACYDKRCGDPCLVEDPCGTNALCKTQTHRPVCYCPETMAGNPKIECFRREYLFGIFNIFYEKLFTLKFYIIEFFKRALSGLNVIFLRRSNVSNVRFFLPDNTCINLHQPNDTMKYTFLTG